MLIPCIDLQRGKAVQLVHGRRRELAVDDVMGLLDRFSGYEWLHIIDLDAAMRKGHNNELVHKLATEARGRFHMTCIGIQTRRPRSTFNVRISFVCVRSHSS